MTTQKGPVISEKRCPDWTIGTLIFTVVGLLIVVLLLLASDDRHARPGTPGDFGYERAGGYRPVNSAKYTRGAAEPYLHVVSWSSRRIWEVDALVENRTVESVAEVLARDYGQGPSSHKRATAALAYFLQFITNDISIPAMSLGSDGKEAVYNFATPPLDGSTIYGKHGQQLEMLRSLVHRQQLHLEDRGGSGEKILRVDDFGFFSTGEVLMGVSPGLASIYTLFARVHNEVADELKRDNPTWVDHDLFFTARAITTGFIQSIVYNEVLPLLVGEERYAVLLSLDKKAYRRHSDVAAFDEVTNAALIARLLMEPYTTEARDVHTGQLALALCGTTAELKNMLVPHGPMWTNGTDIFLLGATMQEARYVSLTSELYGLPLDSMMYGREQGLASYQTVYQLATGTRFTGCRQITNATHVLTALTNAYGAHCELPIDLGVGIAAEDKLPGALYGEAGAYLIELQFGLLRDGDSYFYLWDPDVRPYLERISRFRFVDALKLATRIDPGVIGSLASPFLL